MDRLDRGRFLVAGLLGWGLLLLSGITADAVAFVVTGLVVGLIAFSFMLRTAVRLGPRNLLHLAVPFIGVVAALLAAEWILQVAGPVLHLYAAVAGIAVGASVAAEGTLLHQGGHRPREWMRTALAFVAGSVIAAIVRVTWGAPLALVVLVALAYVAWRLIHRTQDPLCPGDPTRRWLPWGDCSGHAPEHSRRFLAAPLVLVYLGISWALFLPMARPHPDGFHVLPREVLDSYGYHIPDLVADPAAAMLALATAPFLNHDSVQLVYVTVLLLLFGIPLEKREGSLRFVLLFLGTGIAAALVAGILLHLLHPVVAHPILDDAWQRTWSGGSACAFGVLGAVAARALVPWPLLGFFVFWELNVGWWFLQSYTPAFHLTALALGFLLFRQVVPSVRQRPS